MANDSIGSHYWAFQRIHESTNVKRWLLEEQIDFRSSFIGIRLESGIGLHLEVFGKRAIKLHLAVYGVQGRPGNGARDACIPILDQ